MSVEKGNLSINSENFLPIIKKWLYTDKDIFLRELASNACDAVIKLKKLMVMGEANNVTEDEKFEINITLDQKNSIIKISDNGIGMTSDEIKKYINQIAFSGAKDFMEKFSEKPDEGNDIIGHFGLGFYSAFMVADKVEIDSLSYINGAFPAKWSSTGGIEYEMEAGTREKRGTDIILYVGEDGKEFLEEGLFYATLKKYCSFMPVLIYVDIIKEKDEEENPETEDLKEGETEKTPINTTNPLWLKKPSECENEGYIKLYHDIFFDMKDPLFYIHLNMDYPVRLKGILYFPRLIQEMDVMNGQIKLYSNQVYIADNVKEIIPEFLLLLKGVIDCPDLPLNVSRSALQNDGYASEISKYITKKVADKINSLFKNERGAYEGYADDINIFIKYGCMREKSFYEKVKDSLLFRTSDGKHTTISEYLENTKGEEKKIFYATDEKQQAQYINMFKEEGIGVLILSEPIDKPFINFLEYTESERFSLKRIDSDISSELKEETSGEDGELSKEFETLFRGFLGNDKLSLKLEALKTKSISGMMLMDENSRRMQEMKETYKSSPDMLKLFGDMEVKETLVLNKNHPLIKKLESLKGEPGKAAETKLICEEIYDLALLSYKKFSPEEMASFIERSNLILETLSDKI
ncbi:MAG: molecular chaperone HtpG [Lachnospiraceae bacterium]|nr:molecular chaperone HtpG [Lachnospiraceae bacterium]